VLEELDGALVLFGGSAAFEGSEMRRLPVLGFFLRE
jgi:hypothetical protein